jgi:UrcA family protein
MKPIRSLIPIVLLGAIAVANPASAQTRIVSYADLDLSSPEGQEALDRRIRTAVEQVCGRPYPTDLVSQQHVRRCRIDTLSSVQAARNDAFAQAENRRIQLSARR